MKRISEIIKMLQDELNENGDSDFKIYNSSGDVIEPKSFGVGERQFSSGRFEEYLFFSELE